MVRYNLTNQNQRLNGQNRTIREEKENHSIQHWMPLVSPQLEYEEIASVKTCLKTVSAFANYRDGEIIFGVTDSGKVTGVEDPIQEALNLENQINDNIHPQPSLSDRSGYAESDDTPPRTERRRVRSQVGI